ncbi:hypothetical protein B0H66DRAFT_571559 [Apodospora peruviana]|uniref:2EXR domain-containing protein n=1 Tax=Apodospora peruviana TaxID=516989 RepID=A0AAE0IPI8_9PEZI|nr:hypothetical protein B0H66DRAFT_571559 [Apodospora peruviana]
MARRTATRTSRAAPRAVVAPRVPTPIQSNCTTPLSSAYPSTYASEVEPETEDDVDSIPINNLTLSDPAGQSSELAERTPKPKAAKRKPFRFMDLPSELRNRIYSEHFAEVPRVVDLDSDNHKCIHKRLAILRTSRAIYHEASYVFYSTHTFRLFPITGRHFKAKKPLLAKLNKRQRSFITSLELRLGPGFNQPPRGWVVNPALGLADCINLRKLTVFVQCDPSDSFYAGFRRADGFYETFSQGLLNGVLTDLPFIDRVHFDAWPGVKKTGAMMRGLFDVTLSQGRMIGWGPERGWTDADESKMDMSSGQLADLTGFLCSNRAAAKVFILAL